MSKEPTDKKIEPSDIVYGIMIDGTRFIGQTVKDQEGVARNPYRIVLYPPNLPQLPPNISLALFPVRNDPGFILRKKYIESFLEKIPEEVERTYIDLMSEDSNIHKPSQQDIKNIAGKDVVDISKLNKKDLN